MDRKPSFGPNASGIPKLGPRSSTYSGLDSGIPKPRATMGMSRQSSGYGLSRPSLFGPVSAVKSAAGSARKSNRMFQSMSARKSHTPQTGRPSFNPSSVTSSASRQSIGGQRSVQEDRPISEISYHKQCVAKLNDFLQRIGQPALPARFCVSPSSSDIRHVFELLFREMGISLSQIAQPPKTWDQELPNLMRGLGYRYTIGKKFIVSSTSNHSKGQLFGLLDWLVDAISYSCRSGLDHVMRQTHGQGVDVPLEIFKIVLYNDPESRDKKLHQIGETLFGTEEQRREMCQQEIALQTEISVLDEEIEQLQAMEQLLSSYEAEYFKAKKFTQQIEEHLKSHRDIADQELPVLMEKIILTESQIKEQKEKRDMVLAQLKGQEFGQDDLKWARERQQQLKEDVERETKAIEEHKRSLRDVRLTVKQEEDALIKIQSNLHSLLMSLKEAVLSPSIGPYVQQMRDLLQGRQLETVADFLIQPIVMTPEASEKRTMLRNLVREYKTQLLQQTVALEGNVMTKAELQIKELQTAISEKEKTIQSLRDKISELNKEIENERLDAASEHARLKSEYENNQSFLKELGDKLKKSEAETADRVQKLSQMVAEQESELELLKSTRLQWLREYTSKEKNILNTIQHEVDQKLAQLKTYKNGLEDETTRQNARIERLHRKIAVYKASQQQKK